MENEWPFVCFPASVLIFGCGSGQGTPMGNRQRRSGTLTSDCHCPLGCRNLINSTRSDIEPRGVWRAKRKAWILDLYGCLYKHRLFIQVKFTRCVISLCEVTGAVALGASRCRATRPPVPDATTPEHGPGVQRGPCSSPGPGSPSGCTHSGYSE